MKVNEIFRLKPTKGEVGIEIEMEGMYLHQEGDLSIDGWRCERDASLRGESCEYVLSKPVAREEVIDYLGRLLAAFIQRGSVLTPSDRCGVHVHINCQTMDMSEVIRFAVLYLVLEEVMVKYCGESREGNLFCLRAKDAEYLIALLYDALSGSGRIEGYLDDHIRYSSLNLNSLRKYGSLEFRALPTSPAIGEIATWTEMLLDIKDAALVYKSLSDIVESISMMGSKQFLLSIFPTKAELLMCSGIDQMIMNGVRRIQDLAYAERIKNIGKIKYAQSKTGIMEYYSNVGVAQKKKTDKPDFPRDVYLNAHGAQHAANMFHHEDDHYFWDDRTAKWVNHKVQPLNPEEEVFYARHKARVRQAWFDYDEERANAKKLQPKPLKVKMPDPPEILDNDWLEIEEYQPEPDVDLDDEA